GLDVSNASIVRHGLPPLKGMSGKNRQPGSRVSTLVLIDSTGSCNAALQPAARPDPACAYWSFLEWAEPGSNRRHMDFQSTKCLIPWIDTDGFALTNPIFPAQFARMVQHNC